MIDVWIPLEDVALGWPHLIFFQTYLNIVWLYLMEIKSLENLKKKLSVTIPRQ